MIRPLRDVRREAEITAIIEAVVSKGSKFRAAIALNLHRNTLDRVIAKYGIEQRIIELQAERRRQRKLKLAEQSE